MIRTFVTTPFLSTTITTHTELSSNNVYIFKECLKIEINFVFCFFFFLQRLRKQSYECTN